MAKELLRADVDDARLNSLRLLARMIASAYLRQVCQASSSGSSITKKQKEGRHGDKRRI